MVRDELFHCWRHSSRIRKERFLGRRQRLSAVDSIANEQLELLLAERRILACLRIAGTRGLLL